jgi:isoquinoline 1-oxidoreductase subunit beta
VETMIDELATAAGADPFELRRTLLAKSPRHRAVLELAAEKAGWSSPPAAGRFRGIAQHASFGSFVAQVAEVSVVEREIRVHRVVAAIDCGRVVNPAIVRAQMESAIVFGLTAALKSEIRFAEGNVVQGNFDDYPMLRMSEMPDVDVHLIASEEPPSGVGEPGVPPIGPAVANAIFAATGRRLRKLPLRLA